MSITFTQNVYTIRQSSGAVLPSVTGHAGEFLSTDGSSLTWATAGATNETPVYFASRITGVVLDADPDANTGTNNTTLLQAVLTGGNVHLVIDGPCLIDTLLLSSNTILECMGEGLLFRKGQPNGGRNCLMNANPVMGPTAPTDERIILRNVRLDGNRRNYGSGNTGGSSFNSAFDRAIMNDSGHGVVGIGFFGVRYLRIENTHVYDPPAYGLQLANVQDAVIEGFGKTRVPGDIQPTDTIIQLQGHCHRITGTNLYGEALDDALACNANDGQDDAGATTGPEPGLVAPGPISEITFRSCKFSSVLQICRFLSANAANTITNILIEDVTATMGLSSSYGYAGFLFDDFGLTGPLTDGTHGWVDGVLIRNVKLTGFTTGPPYGTVHFGACKFGRVTVENLRVNTAANPVNPAVLVAAGATGDTLVLSRVADESYFATTPAISIKGAVRSVTVDGCEYDQYLAGHDEPHPWTNDPNQSFFPTALVRIEAAVDNLLVRGTRSAGISEVVRCVGVAPKSITIGGLVHRATKGGAVLRSDTVLPNVVLYGLDADQTLDVPGGSSVTYLGTNLGDTATVNLRCDFLENAAGVRVVNGDQIQDLVTENGVTWGTISAGSGTLRATGTGWLYATGPAIHEIHVPGKPTADNFDVEFDIVRKSVLAAGEWFYVQFFSDATNVGDFYGFVFDPLSLSIRHNNSTVIQTSSTMPAVGVVWRIRCKVTSVGSARTVKTYKSTDGGRTWTSLLADASFTTTTPKSLALYALSAGSGWTSTTGNHVGGIVVKSYAPQTLHDDFSTTGNLSAAAGTFSGAVSVGASLSGTGGAIISGAGFQVTDTAGSTLNINDGGAIDLDSTGVIRLAASGAAIILNSLPVTDPTSAGQLYCDPGDGLLRVSQG